MRKYWIACSMAAALFSTLASGQAPATLPVPPPCAENCMAKEVQGNYARVKANILKSADKMPAEDYTFKPTPDIRTFARVVNHVTEAQLHVCEAIDGVKSGQGATVPPETADKAAIVAALNASFAACDKAYAGLTDANIAEMFQMGPVKRSRLGALWGNASHDNEQYATLALYMRLKGLTPPSSEK